MKKFKIFLLIAVFAIQIQAQDKGIQFIHEEWGTALERAQAEDKIIFVDAYTTWCGPCKWMAANVFPEKEVADYYNEHFINLKLDMEKGEGLKFAKDYQVRAYPTLLFIDKNGQVVHKALGGRQPAQFVALGEAASDPDRQVYTLKRKYEAGEESPAFLKKYAKAMGDAYMDGTEEVAQKYLASQTDWKTAENMQFIFDFAGTDTNSKLFKEILDNRSVYSKLVGDEMLTNKIRTAAMTQLRTKKVDVKDLAAIEKVFIPLFPVKGKQFAAATQLSAYQRSTDKADQQVFLDKAVKYMKLYKEKDSNFLNSISWAFYEMTDDPAYLKKACKWAKQSVKADSQFHNNDTLAAVCYKLKKKGKAKKYAEKAIALAKVDNADYSETEELLKKINSL